MTWRAILLFPVTFFPILALTTCGAQEGHPVSWKGLAFSTPVEFSTPAEIGLDAVTMLTPKDASSQSAALELRLVYVPREMLESFGGSTDETLNYVRITFFGVAEAGSPLPARRFLGNEVAGLTQQVDIPRSAVLELYMLPVSDGSYLVMGLYRNGDTAKETADDIMDMIAETLREESTK